MAIVAVLAIGRARFRANRSFLRDRGGAAFPSACTRRCGATVVRMPAKANRSRAGQVSRPVPHAAPWRAPLPSPLRPLVGAGFSGPVRPASPDAPIRWRLKSTSTTKGDIRRVRDPARAPKRHVGKGRPGARIGCVPCLKPCARVSSRARQHHAAAVVRLAIRPTGLRALALVRPRAPQGSVNRGGVALSVPPRWQRGRRPAFPRASGSSGRGADRQPPGCRRPYPRPARSVSRGQRP